MTDTAARRSSWSRGTCLAILLLTPSADTLADSIHSVPEPEAKRIALDLNNRFGVVGSRFSNKPGLQLVFVRKATVGPPYGGRHPVHADFAALFDLTAAAPGSMELRRASECDASHLGSYEEVVHDPDTGGPAPEQLVLNSVYMVSTGGALVPALGVNQDTAESQGWRIAEVALREGKACFAKVEEKRKRVDASVARIRKRYGEINASKALRTEKRANGTAWLDGTTVVKLVEQHGTEYSQSSSESYFDPSGNIIFVFTKGSMQGDHSWECRSYYEAGKRIRFLVGEETEAANCHR